MNRRKFLKLLAGGVAGATVGMGAVEAGQVRLSPLKVAVRRLPAAFEGLRVALVTDVHYGLGTTDGYLVRLTALAQEAQPDVILLGGDYIHYGKRYIEPCFELLGQMHAPLGVHAVLGNHDHWASAERSWAAMAANNITSLDNKGIWLERQGQRLRLCGTGDLWTNCQDLSTALGDTRPDETALLLQHNPDYAEQITDERVGLVLSGHTHGGQVVLPLLGPPILASRYGQKYVHGLVQAPHTQVFVSRGVGTITPPIRWSCPPEVNLLTLHPAPEV